MQISVEHLERLICCPDGKCCSPYACYATDRSRSQLVSIEYAAKAVHELITTSLAMEPARD